MQKVSVLKHIYRNGIIKYHLKMSMPSLGTQGFYIFHFPTCAPIISIVHIILLAHKLGSMLSLSVCIPKTLEGFYPYHIFTVHHLKRKKNVSHSFSGPSKASFNNNKKSYVLNNYINNLQIIYSTKISSMIVLNQFFLHD